MAHTKQSALLAELASARAAMEHAYANLDFDAGDKLRQIRDDLQEMYRKEQAMFGGIFDSGFGNNTQGMLGSGNSWQISNGISQAHTNQYMHNYPSTIKYECGVLYFRDKPIPDDWRGAEISRFDKIFDGEEWYIRFYSDWAQETITLRLETQQHSGAEADTLAKTYMESLNQRRLG